MKEIISIFSSLILMVTTALHPAATTKGSANLTAMPSATSTITKTAPTILPTAIREPTITVNPTSKPRPPAIKTPSLAFNDSGYVITARRGNKIKVTSIIPIKTTKVTGVNFDGGSPAGVSWSTSIVNGEANVYLTVGNETKIGEHNWTQKIVVSFDVGYTRDFAYTVKLKVIPQ